MSAQIAVYWLWGVWYVTWLAAVVFSGRTKVQMGREGFGLHRLAASVGVLLLFMPATWAGPLGTTLWPEPAAAQWALVALTAAAFAFCWWARLHLGRLWSGFVTLKEDHRIVDTGPYGLVRHPIYSGVMFAALMTALIEPTPVSLAGFALLTAGFAMTAKVEEGFLRGQLGVEAYEAYAHRVPMLVPKFS
ncbi:MAG TPA: isoprenylcysteine carboxylmethyltransferase family protein [Caulobacteraceae bacterium]|jgi:protein-S-isoprenylcysteine O-methyltransferase Ste14|nr:isoprenylcysteine carboxylmethyltransferase family protein [Caulobacteraceae bacterium]